MQQIPAELVSDILGYLSGSDMRNVASVDRRLYRAAQDAGCLIFRTVDLSHPETLATFKEIVVYAAGKDPRDRPGLGLRLFVNCTATTRSAFESHFQLALNTIKASIRLLVHLEAYVPSFFAEDLHGTLRSGPAPLLRILALGQACRGQLPAVSIPSDLFQNTAPHLGTISLVFPTLEAQWQPVTVFKNVRTARLTLYRTNNPIRVARLLPQVTSLVVDLAPNKPHPGTRPELNLSGMNLRRLTMDANIVREGSECTLSGIDIAQLPVFECGSGTAFTHRLWETTAPSDEPVRARVTSARFMKPATPECALTLESAGCTRTAFGDGMIHSPIDGAHATGIGTRLTVVMLDSPAYLDDLLAVQTPLVALAELYINIAGHSCLLDSPGASTGSVSVRYYPALKAITLFAGENHTVYALHANNVAEFGQMLGLDAQPAAVLRMVRVGFVQPMPRKRLASVFPVVEFPEKLDLQGARRAEPRDCHVERPFFVPDFVVRHA